MAGTGSMEKRGRNSWRLIVSDGIGDDGRYIKKTKTVRAKDKNEATKLLKKYVQEVTGKNVEPWESYEKEDEKKELRTVYFIMAMDGSKTPPVKIGFAKDVASRIKSIQTGCPYKLKVLGFIETYNYKKLETFLHRLFFDRRMEGEWFSLSIKDIRNILDVFDVQEIVKY